MTKNLYIWWRVNFLFVILSSITLLMSSSLFIDTLWFIILVDSILITEWITLVREEDNLKWLGKNW